jgi:cytochrome P450
VAAADPLDASRPAQIDPLDASTWQDLPGATGRWREQHPLAIAPQLATWFVLRHADVLRLLGDDRLASGYAGFGEGTAGRVASGLLVNQRGERHARLRRLVARAFTPRQIEQARVATRARVRGRLAALETGQTLDFQRDVADLLARAAIADRLGIPEADLGDFSRWVVAVVQGLGPLAPADLREAADAAAERLFAYLAELVAHRRREPGCSALDALLAAEGEGETLTAHDLEQLVMSLLIGGTDTVRSFLGILTFLLLQHPDMLARLRGSPALAAPTVEEALRFEPPLSGVPRVATAPIQLAGVEIPAGGRVVLSLVAANRDPRRFPEPDRFEPLRDVTAHLSFGRGTHFCVGAALARMEAQELLLGLAASDAPRLVLVESPRWVPFLPARRLEALRVTVC